MSHFKQDTLTAKQPKGSQMEFRFLIPDSPKRAFSALKYYLKVRQSPVKCYGIEDFRAVHKKMLVTRTAFDDLEAKYRKQTAKLVEAQKELSKLRRSGK